MRLEERTTWIQTWCESNGLDGLIYPSRTTTEDRCGGGWVVTRRSWYMDSTSTSHSHEDWLSSACQAIRKDGAPKSILRTLLPWLQDRPSIVHKQTRSLSLSSTRDQVHWRICHQRDENGWMEASPEGTIYLEHVHTECSVHYYDRLGKKSVPEPLNLVIQCSFILAW